MKLYINKIREITDVDYQGTPDEYENIIKDLLQKIDDLECELEEEKEQYERFVENREEGYDDGYDEDRRMGIY